MTAEPASFLHRIAVSVSERPVPTVSGPVTKLPGMPCLGSLLKAIRTVSAGPRWAIVTTPCLETAIPVVAPGGEDVVSVALCVPAAPWAATCTVTGAR